MTVRKPPAKTTKATKRVAKPKAAAAEAQPAPPTDPSRLDRLRVLRDRLTYLIDHDDCCVCEKPKPSQTAPLAGRLVVVLEQIDALEVAGRQRVSRVDDLAARRTTRRASAAH